MYVSKKKQKKMALDDLEADELNATYFFTYIEHAAIYRIKKQYKKALHDINAAINLNPGYAKAYEMLAALKMDTGEYSEAAVFFAIAKKLENNIGSELLMEFYSKMETLSELHIAVYYGNRNKVKRILENGADVNIKNLDGITPLMIAVADGDEITTEMLIKYGENVNERDRYGNTPLHYSIKHKSIVNILLNNKADPNVINTKMQTPLDIAVYGGFRETIELLINAGAKSVLAKDINGMTKLHYAALYSNCKYIEILLSQGANINSQNIKRQTPLHIAVINKNIDICQLLLEKGAYSNQPDLNGNSPIQLAIDNKCDDIVELLLACSLTG